MTLEPLLTTTPIIQLHLIFAVLALLTGPVALFRKRRDWLHKRVGYVALMSLLGLAATGLAIKSHIAMLFHMGPIHVLCFITFWGVGEAFYSIRCKDIPRHRAAMRSTWFGALGLAGLLSFLPGRVLNRMLFGQPSSAGYIIIAVGLVGLWQLWRTTRGDVDFDRT